MSIKKSPQEIKSAILALAPDTEVLLRGEGEYDEKRNPFNLRFDVYPAVIAFCKTTEEAKAVVKIAKKNSAYTFRVRSGAHDHAGECTGDDAIVIDFSQMDGVDLNDDTKIVKIESGVLFEKVIPILNKAGVCITCQTVGVMGFTLGGGLGPWTRLQGMCCEHVVGATFIDKDGKDRFLDINNPEDKALLWALKGGGGFTFGILTELFIQTFAQPKHTLRFTASWINLFGRKKNIAPAIDILEAWEKAIAPGANKNLIGTNLQIHTEKADNIPVHESMHEINFYGYYGTDEDDILGALAKDLESWFPGDLEPVGISVAMYDKDGHKHKENFSFEAYEKKFNVIKVDRDKFSNFVLTSKMVQDAGLGKAGRENLIRTLQSEHVDPFAWKAHVHTYVTLGSISGNYYDQGFERATFPEGVSFPFQKSPYTIQYQVWWNETERDKEYYDEAKVAKARKWLKEAREFDFPQTKGSFISFKDAAIPIKEYFLESYDRLHTIKKEQDPDNFFGSATTIKA